MSSFWDKLQPAARGGPAARTSDVNYRLLVPLLLNVAIIQAVYAIVRVTTSYRAIELNLPVVWLGIISATFAILPIIFAVQVGRFLDRGKDAQAAWLGASLLVLACAGFRFAAGASFVLDDETAVQRAPQHVGFIPGEKVVRSAGRKRHDDSYRAAGIIVGSVSQRAEQTRSQRNAG